MADPDKTPSGEMTRSKVLSDETGRIIGAGHELDERIRVMEGDAAQAKNERGERRMREAGNENVPGEKASTDPIEEMTGSDPVNEEELIGAEEMRSLLLEQQRADRAVSEAGA